MPVGTHLCFISFAAAASRPSFGDNADSYTVHLDEYPSANGVPITPALRAQTVQICGYKLTQADNNEQPIPFTIDVIDAQTGEGHLKVNSAAGEAAHFDCHKTFHYNVAPVDCANVTGDS